MTNLLSLTKRETKAVRPSLDITRFLSFLLAAAILCNAWLGISLAKRIYDNVEDVDHSHRAQLSAAQLLKILTDAETGQRGYLLTGEREYLKPYDAAAGSVDAAIAELKSLTHVDQQQAELVDELVPWIDRKMAELQETIDLLDAGQRDESLTLVTSDVGEKYMEKIRSNVSKLIENEERRLSERAGIRDRTYAQSQWSWSVAGGALLMVLSLFLATSRRRNAELVAARDAATTANRSRGEFIANMSHEIRTPMTAIIGNAEILQEELKDPDNLQLVQTIKANSNHLLTIVNDILDLAKIDAGKLGVDRVACRVDGVVGEVYSILRPVAHEKNLALCVDFLTAVPDEIMSDPVRLRQILINLVGNAIKFTETGSVTIAVEHRPDQCSLRFAVQDTGIGIAPGNIERLFDPFEQSDASRTRRYEGTGLGLPFASV